MRRSAAVIGAGPAGLAAAAELTRARLEVRVLERTGVVGASWRRRYDRLRLNTVRWLSGLPGAPIAREHGRWVARDAYVAYLEAYAASRKLDLRFHVEARRVHRVAGGWTIETHAGTVRSDVVVVATGYDHTPRPIEWPGVAAFSGEVVHAAAYADATTYVGRDVLVTGAGSTGLEIATDLAEGGARRVWVARRTPPNFIAREYLGLPLTPLALLERHQPSWMTDALGRLLQRLQHGDLSDHGLPPSPVGMGTRLREDGRGPVIVDGFVEQLRAGRLEVVDELLAFDDGAAVLAGGNRVRPDAVIAATGYERGLERLVGHLGVLRPDGRPRTSCGLPDPALPGLYFIGYTVPLSGQLHEIAADARRLRRSVAADCPPRRVAGRPGGPRTRP